MRNIQVMAEKFLGVSVIISKDVEDTLAHFDIIYRLAEGLQPMFLLSDLKQTMQQMPLDNVLFWSEPLGASITLFWLDSHMVLIGPYLTSSWDDKNSESILMELGVTTDFLLPYKLHYSRYGVVTEELVVRAVKAMLATLDRSIDDYQMVKLNRKSERIAMNLSDMSAEYTYEQVTKRYAIEAEFMKQIGKGDAVQAKIELEKLRMSSQQLLHTRNTLWAGALGSSMLRTLIRIAAAQAGLPPIVVDAITQSYGQKLYRTLHNSSTNNGQQMTGLLIDDICYEIIQMHKSKYSPLVYKAHDLITLNLSHPLSLQTIAMDLHISPGHLAKQFRAETGTTVVEQIKKKRVEKAMDLLRNTNHTIQDISAYVGYHDNNYFVKVFRSQAGMTPSQYRSQHQK